MDYSGLPPVQHCSRFASACAKQRLRNGFSNQTALLLIALGYPIGFASLSLVYTASNNRGYPSSNVLSQNRSEITQESARSAIENWWDVRSQVFASPYNIAAASEYVAAGPLWDDLNKSDGPVAWLRNRSQYYTYQSTVVERVISFDPGIGSRPSMVIRVSSSITLQGPGIYEPSSSTNDYRYTFAYEGGRWKIWNYEQV